MGSGLGSFSVCWVGMFVCVCGDSWVWRWVGESWIVMVCMFVIVYGGLVVCGRFGVRVAVSDRLGWYCGVRLKQSAG